MHTKILRRTIFILLLFLSACEWGRMWETPAVKPHELLEKYLGENVNYYTSEHWVLDESHIQQFFLL